MSKKTTESQYDPRVTIDMSFVRDQARDAVHQFFRPLIAPFEHTASSADEKAPLPASPRKG